MVPDSHLEGSSQIRGGIPRLLKPVTDVTASNGLWRDRLLDEFIQGPSAAQVPSFKSPMYVFASSLVRYQLLTFIQAAMR
jgi:hypothetical protein